MTFSWPAPTPKAMEQQGWARRFSHDSVSLCRKYNSCHKKPDSKQQEHARIYEPQPIHPNVCFCQPRGSRMPRWVWLLSNSIGHACCHCVEIDREISVVDRVENFSEHCVQSERRRVGRGKDGGEQRVYVSRVLHIYRKSVVSLGPTVCTHILRHISRRQQSKSPKHVLEC
jgi:hypothetical protein